MCNENTKSAMISSIVRSTAIAVILLPVTLSITGGVSKLVERAEDTTSVSAQLEQIKAELVKDCVSWKVAIKDTKVERQAETAIDEYFDGSVGYQQVCNWVLK